MKAIDAWLEDLAAATPAPGGGSAAALAGALAGALVAMVARLAAPDRDSSIAREADALRAGLTRLVDEDAAAYARVIAANRLPKNDPARQQAKDDALLTAAAPQLEVARRASRLLALAREAGGMSSAAAKPDAAVAEHLARAALLSALENVRANVAAMSSPARGTDLMREAERLAT